MAGRKLKVFQAQFGFYDTVVAAPSQAAALRAWGTRQNLFASGEARLATDGAAVAAALAHPDTLLRRAVGSADPFQLEPASLPRPPDAPKRATAKTAGAPTPAARRQPPADRTALNAAELALHTLDEVRRAEEADFQRRQAALDVAKTAAQSAYAASRKAAAAAVAKAREAYRKAGGEG